MIKIVGYYLLFAVFIALATLMGWLIWGEGSQAGDWFVLGVASVFYLSRLGDRLKLPDVVQRWGWAYWGRFLLFLLLALCAFFFVTINLLAPSLWLFCLVYNIFPYASQVGKHA